MDNSDKLYRVTLRGMTYSSTGVAHGISYVVANNVDAAYKVVKDFLDINDIGFPMERELDKIELLAEDWAYSYVGCMLHFQQEKNKKNNEQNNS